MTKRHQYPRNPRRLRKTSRVQYPSVQSLLWSWGEFCELSLDRDAGWVVLPKWQRRYKALRRSARNHGHKLETIDALMQVQHEWEASELEAFKSKFLL